MMEVSEGVAAFFKDQVVGESAGQMAMVPNNPVLFGLAAAHGVIESDAKFAAFLRDIADWVDGGGNA